MRLSTLVIGLLILTSAVSAKHKDRSWQTGKILSSERHAIYAGERGSASATATTNGDTTTANASGDSRAIYGVYWTYVIESPPYTYECTERTKWRWSKPALVTVNGPVQFAVEKGRLYILAEDDTEHETEIVRKTLKP